MTANKQTIVFFLDFADSLENADRVGSVARIIRYFNELSKGPFSVNVLSPDLKNYTPQLTGGRHYPLPHFAGVNRLIAFLIFSPIIFRGLLKDAHLFWAKFSSSVPALLAKQLFGKPVVNYFDYNWVELSAASSELKLEFKIKGFIEGLMIRHSDYFITTTDTLKTYLIERGFRYPERIFVIPNSVDTDLFKPSHQSDQGAAIKIVSVGRLNEQKNFSLLIRGVAVLKQSTDRRVELTIVGAGPHRESLLREAADQGVHLTIVDRVPNNEMPSVYCSHHVFVMTSPREGHPRALIEAMSCGLPTVGTNVAGIRDVISDNDNGLLCAETPDAVAAQIYRVTHERELAKRLGDSARNHALQHFSSEALLRKESAVYRQILGCDDSSS